MNYMIVFLHAWAAFQYVEWNCVEFHVFRFLCSHLCWVAIPTFFLISGYLLFQQFSLKKWPDKLWRRVKRLSVPYVVWNMTFVLFYLSLSCLVPRLGKRVAMFGLDTLGGAISKILSLTVAPIDGPLWFIRVLFLLVLVSPGLWFVMRIGKGIPALILSLGWCVAESCLGLEKTLHLTFPAYAITCFLSGGVLAVKGKEPVACFSRKWCSLLLLGLAACGIRAYLLMFTMAEAGAGSNDGMIVFCSISVSVLAILEAPALIALVSRWNVERITQNKVYQFLRDMSFFSYAGHFLFCSMWLHTVAPLLGGHWAGKFTVLILIFVGCGVPTMAVVYWGAKRLCPKVLKLFDGTL